MIDNFSFDKLFGITKNSISIFFRNINVFYLGIISVIFSAVIFVLNYINIKNSKIPSKFTKSYINHLYSFYSSHTSEIIIILIVLFIYLLISIYFTSFSSTALIKYVLGGESSESFLSSWDRGKEKWKEYIVYYIIYYIIAMIISVIVILISAFFLIIPIINFLVLIVLILFFVVVFSLSFIGIRLVLDPEREMDVIDAIRMAYKFFWQHKLEYLRVTSFYIMVFVVLYLIFGFILESIIIKVALSLIAYNFLIGVSFEIIGTLIALYVSAFISVFSSVYWTKIYSIFKNLSYL